MANLTCLLPTKQVINLQQRLTLEVDAMQASTKGGIEIQKFLGSHGVGGFLDFVQMRPESGANGSPRMAKRRAKFNRLIMTHPFCRPVCQS